MTSWSSQQAAEALLQAAGSVEVRTAADPVAPGGLVDPGRDELAVGLRVSPDSMRGRIATVRRLHQFPAVTALVAEGLVSYVAGKLLVGELRNIGQDTAAVVTQVIADRVRDRHRLGLRPWGWREIADLLRRLLAALPDQVAKRARKTAFDARGVSVSDAGDGMATICATVRDVDAHRIYARLSAVAASLAAEDDPRTRDQQRADVLTDLLLDPPTGCACAGARAGAEAGGDCGARGDCGAATADSGGAGAAAHSDGASPGAPAGPGSAPRGTCPCGGDAGPEGCGSGSGYTGHGDAADDRDRMGPDDTFSDHQTGSKVDGPPAHDVPPPEPPDDAGAPPDPLDDSIEDRRAESRSDWPGPPPPWLPGGWPFGRASGYELNRWSNAPDDAAPDAAAPEAWPEPPHDHSEGRPDGRLDDTSADGPHHGPREAAGDPVGCCCGCHGAPSPAGTSGLPPGRGLPPGQVLPGGGGVEVNVVLSLDTLLGVADDPGHIAGMGPVPADVARELAADGRWRAWVTDTVSGVVVATSPGTYRPTAALQRLIRAREPYCRFPGCRRAATGCDLDHTITFPRGPSEAWNLGPLCRRHHNNKTHHNYRLTGPPDPDTAATNPSWTWTTPTGQTSHDHTDPPLR